MRKMFPSHCVKHTEPGDTQQDRQNYSHWQAVSTLPGSVHARQVDASNDQGGKARGTWGGTLAHMFNS
jgi:hypothetical protein